MRKKRILPFLLLVLLLTGCAGRDPAVSGSTAERNAPGEAVKAAASEQAVSAAAEESISASMVAAEARPLPEEEILDAYDRAVTAYSWFVLTPLPDTGQTVPENGVTYRRVDYRGIKDMEDLRDYLNGMFAPELTERLLATGGDVPMYRDIDGSLYVTGSGRSRNLYKGHAQIQTGQVSSTEYSVNVSVDLLDDDQMTVTGLEYWSFPYVFTGDRWVFAEFGLIY